MKKPHQPTTPPVPRHPAARRPAPRQRGVVLISALLLLIVMTILALFMFRSNGVQELIAGNVREKQRAVQSAESAMQYAEIWLSDGANVLSNMTDCSTIGVVPYISTSVPPICLQALASIDDALNVTTLPWTVGGAETGFTFYPGGIAGTGDMTVSTTGGANAYYQVPRYWISYAGKSGNAAMYQIDAWNYAGTQSTSALVETNFVVTCTVCPL